MTGQHWYTIDTYQSLTKATPARHVSRARTLRAMVIGSKPADFHHACTPVAVNSLGLTDGLSEQLYEYRHELQVSAKVYAYLQKLPNATPIKPVYRL